MMISALAAYAASLCFTAATAWAGWMDLSTMKIRNELVVFLLAAYAALAPLAGVSVAEIGWNAAAALSVFSAMFLFFCLGWIGGGDAKLASVIALWIGADHALDFLVYTALFGGALTLIILQFRSIGLPPQYLRSSWIARLHSTNSGVPYGVAIAAGALFIFPNTAWMTALS
ncbi:A24 family peptidase [Microvirga aerophila]|nr:prepilin peptidase [Microvirga aerophila]